MTRIEALRKKFPNSLRLFSDEGIINMVCPGELLEGELPGKQYKLVQAWMALHADELMADWKLAVSGATPDKIEPLR